MMESNIPTMYWTLYHHLKIFKRMAYHCRDVVENHREVSGEAGETEGTVLMTFGPVPSRRLGRSLGINNIPPKTCSYACLYCQLGRDSAHVNREAIFLPSGDPV